MINMASWLCILNSENFETVKNEQVWGVAERHKKWIAKAKLGDLCAFYIMGKGSITARKEPAIGGIFKVTSEPYEDRSDIFPSKSDPNERYPYRLRLKVVEVFVPEMPFKPLIPVLDFITYKKNYSSDIRGRAMKEISEKDMKKIQKKARRKETS